MTMPIELAPLGTMILTMQPAVVLANTPAGTRVIIEFSDVQWTGERLTAHRKGTAAADWLLIGPDGTATLDIRFMLETHDGATIYVHGGGMTDSATFAQGAPTFFIPIFETSDTRYTWLHRIQAVAKGSANGSVVTFEVCEVR